MGLSWSLPRWPRSAVATPVFCVERKTTSHETGGEKEAAVQLSVSTRDFSILAVSWTEVENASTPCLRELVEELATIQNLFEILPSLCRFVHARVPNSDSCGTCPMSGRRVTLLVDRRFWDAELRVSAVEATLAVTLVRPSRRRVQGVMTATAVFDTSTSDKELLSSEVQHVALAEFPSTQPKSFTAPPFLVSESRSEESEPQDPTTDDVRRARNFRDIMSGARSLERHLTTHTRPTVMVVMDMRSSTEYVLQEGALKAAATCARIQFDAHALLLNHFEPFVKFQEAVGDMMLFVSRGSHVGLVAAVHFAAALETLLKGLCRVSVVQGNVCFTNINGVPRLFGGSVNMACRIQSFTSEGTIAVQESCWRAFERASVSIAWSSKSETSKLDGDREVLDGMCTKRLLRLKGFRDEVSCVFVDASAMTEAFFRAVDVDSRCSVSHQNIEVRHDMT